MVESVERNFDFNRVRVPGKLVPARRVKRVVDFLEIRFHSDRNFYRSRNPLVFARDYPHRNIPGRQVGFILS